MFCRHAIFKSTCPFRSIPQRRMVSDLGLRSHLPPDTSRPDPSSPHFSSPNTNHNQPDDAISDAEWEIRTGRAIFVLQHTLPHFFETGLVTSVNTITGTPDDPRSSSKIVGDAFKLPINPPPIPVLGGLGGGNQDRNTTTLAQEHEAIYSPKVRLAYTPPVALPAPFPKTLSIEGFPLYIASSTFVRHTLKALYTDLRVDIYKFAVYTAGSNNPPPPGAPGQGFFTGSTPETGFAQSRSRDMALGFADKRLETHHSQKNNPDAETHEVFGGLNEQGGKKKRLNRDKSLLVGLKVSGIARVSRAANEWDVSSTYTFSPLTGLILSHVINSIHPAPHQAVYDSLRSNLGKVFGWGSIGERGAPTGLPRPANAGAGAIRYEDVGLKSGKK